MLGAVLLGLGIWALRSETMTTHVAVPADSQLEVVVEATKRGGDRGQGPEAMVSAKVHMCRLEVQRADVIAGPTRLGDDRFRFVLEPTLDESDRVQFRGCVQDWNIDHLLVDVVRMESSSHG